MIARVETLIPHTTFEVTEVGYHQYDLLVDDEIRIHKFLNTAFIVDGQKMNGGVLIVFTNNNKILGMPFQIKLCEGKKDILIEDRLDSVILNLRKKGVF